MVACSPDVSLHFSPMQSGWCPALQMSLFMCLPACVSHCLSVWLVAWLVAWLFERLSSLVSFPFIPGAVYRWCFHFFFKVSGFPGVSNLFPGLAIHVSLRLLVVWLSCRLSSLVFVVPGPPDVSQFICLLLPKFLYDLCATQMVATWFGINVPLDPNSSEGPKKKQIKQKRSRIRKILATQICFSL